MSNYRIEVRCDFTGTEEEARAEASRVAERVGGKVTAIFDDDWEELSLSAPASVSIYLKGWRDPQLLETALSEPGHLLHPRAVAVRDRSFRPYEPGDAVYFVLSYTDHNHDNDQTVCARAYRMFNIDDPATDETVRRYRDGGHRSLSVGDVVMVDDRAYGVADVGFEAIENFQPRSR